MALIESAQVGGNPYQSLARRVVNSTSIHEVANCQSSIEDARTNIRNNVSLFYFDNELGAIDLRSVNPVDNVLFIAYGGGRTPMNPVGWISNEDRKSWAYGPETQDSTPNKSVRDGNISGAIEGYPPVPADVVQYEFDDRFVKVATAFGPWAQYQLNPVTGERGKNVRLAPQQD